MKTTPHTLLTFLLLSPLALGAPENDAPIDQVVVEAKKANVVKLAKEVRLAEFRFYDLYNKLNTEPDYAVNCENEPSTGSRFTWDNCKPVFQDKAQQTEASAFGRFLQGISTTPGGGVAASATPGMPASMAISAGRPGFQQHMTELTRKNPELTKLLNEYAARLKQYQDATRKATADIAR